MPEFILNDKDTREFTQLPEIVQGFIEAMFFTECEGSIADDTFDPENGSQLPDEASWLEIHPDSLKRIVETVTAWRDEHAALLEQAYEAERKDVFLYDEIRAGNDLWYTSNGHGVGFWDRGFTDELGKALTAAAKEFGESCVFWETTDEDECTGIVYVD